MALSGHHTAVIEYYSYIHFDENNNMTSFEMMSEIARDRKE